MKAGFYPKLAWTGIKKNKRMYLPYIMTCSGMVMMYYIISYLTESSILSIMPGGDIMQSILTLGSGIIAVFSVIFLFYTNSFLVKRRNKEFGLYNILGMDKKNISLVILWETVIYALISLVTGILGGILFSKLAELVLVNIVHGKITYALTLSVDSIFSALILFSGIFALLFLNTLRQVHMANPIALMHSENVGERPPRGNVLFGILGLVILIAAYIIAVSIEDPVSALALFFAAAIMVIAATYLIFISGSVLLCRLLQKNRRYYYKANHFVSVSSMTYRMKRNGAGLASICILATMVLVMIASTTALYVGEEDSLHSRYPSDFAIETDLLNDEITPVDPENKVPAIIGEAVKKAADTFGLKPQNPKEYTFAGTSAVISEGRMVFNTASLDFNNYWQIYFIGIDDYNAMSGQNIVLGEHEALVAPYREDYKFDKFNAGSLSFGVRKIENDFLESGSAAMSLIPTLNVIVPNLEEIINESIQSGEMGLAVKYRYSFDTEADTETQIEAQNSLYSSLKSSVKNEFGEDHSISVDNRAAQRENFYSLFGSLLFLCIVLSVVFIFAAVLIIYYKQISEGYEDRSRFEIMQKVGMTKKEIKRSINSQLLTVFFMPLITAGIHLIFAFPMIHKMLILFNLMNLPLLIGTTIVSFIIFAVFYTSVYRITSNSYYSIVSDSAPE